MKKIYVVFCIFAVLFFAVAIAVLCQPKYPKKYVKEISEASSLYGVDKSLVFAICYAESSFNANAVSQAGAKGIMQIMPQTATWIASDLGVETYDLFDAKTNIEFGCYYLKYLFLKFNDEIDVVAAYNAGENNVRMWLGEKMILESNEIQFGETREYVKKVLKAKSWYEKH